MCKILSKQFKTFDTGIKCVNSDTKFGENYIIAKISLSRIIK